MGRKLGAVPLLGELSPHITQCGRGWGLRPCQVSLSLIQPFGHNTPTSQTDRTDSRLNSRPETDEEEEEICCTEIFHISLVSQGEPVRFLNYILYRTDVGPTLSEQALSETCLQFVGKAVASAWWWNYVRYWVTVLLDLSSQERIFTVAATVSLQFAYVKVITTVDLVLNWFTCYIVTFCVRHSWGEMYVGHSCLSVCLSVPCHIPTLLHRPGFSLGEW